MGAGSSAIAAAASQALAATHYNVPGRRSSSLKASFQAISQGVATRDLSIGQVSPCPMFAGYPVIFLCDAWYFFGLCPKQIPNGNKKLFVQYLIVFTYVHIFRSWLQQQPLLWPPPPPTRPATRNRNSKQNPQVGD